MANRDVGFYWAHYSDLPIGPNETQSAGGVAHWNDSIWQFGGTGQFDVDDSYVGVQSSQLQPPSSPVGALYYWVYPLREGRQWDIAALDPNDNVWMLVKGEGQVSFREVLELGPQLQQPPRGSISPHEDVGFYWANTTNGGQPGHWDGSSWQFMGVELPDNEVLGVFGSRLKPPDRSTEASIYRWVKQNGRRNWEVSGLVPRPFPDNSTWCFVARAPEPTSPEDERGPLALITN
ncbi:hypothetical protein R69746_07235 [Paraburkholderia aspalathi]|nr:hypothetical protein R69746_07235 [Paraburkholderia aspalathi]